MLPPIFVQKKMLFLCIFLYKMLNWLHNGWSIWRKYATPHFCAEKGLFYVYFSYKMLKNPLYFRFFMQKLQENGPIMAQKWGVAYLHQKWGLEYAKIVCNLWLACIIPVFYRSWTGCIEDQLQPVATAMVDQHGPVLGSLGPVASNLGNEKTGCSPVAPKLG